MVRRLAGILTGSEADTLGIARGVHTAIGFAALSDVKQDFIRKSRGETGEDGVKWKPLSPEYLAYGRRFGRGEQRDLKAAAGLGKAHRFAPGGSKGLLTVEQLKRWQKLFAQHMARLSVSMFLPEAKAAAAAMAWNTLKSEGAQTKLQVYGTRTVDINRDTGVLFNSLSPGDLSGSGANLTYTKPSGEGGAEQVFEIIGNGVIVGTNVAYAAAVNKQRPFLPKSIPQAWLERWLAVANDAILVGARMLLGAA